MKRLTALLLTFFLTSISFHIKAQDDTNCGLLVDGILIDSLNCWTFKEIKAVVPIKSEWQKFDKVQVRLRWYCTKYSTEVVNYYDFKPRDFKDGFLSTAQYGVMPLPNLKTENDRLIYAESYYWSNYTLNEEAPPLATSFQIEITGYFTTGTTETYVNGSYQKQPKYGDPEVLWKSKKIPSIVTETPMKAAQKFFKKNPGKRLPALTKQCSLTGKKFDLTIEQINYKEDFLIIKKK